MCISLTVSQWQVSKSLCHGGPNCWRAFNRTLRLHCVLWTTLQAINLGEHFCSVPNSQCGSFKEKNGASWLWGPSMFGQLITAKQNWGIMHLSEFHFKLLVRVGVCTGTAVDADKWWRQWALLELGDTYQQGGTRNFSAFLQFICGWRASRLHRH